MTVPFRLSLIIASVVLMAPALGSAQGRLEMKALIDVQAQHLEDSLDSWYGGGPLNLRYGDDENTLQIGQLGLEGKYRTGDTSTLEATAIYFGGKADEVTLTEAFWQWRPLPSSNWRQTLKVGSFYAPISQEHTGPLWSSPYSINGSAINSWLADEVRTVGAEWRWKWQDQQRQQPWSFSLLGSIYGFNDTAGTMLSWRGWSSGDRQSGAGSTIKTSNFPALEFPFHRQAPQFEPFIETDNRPGYYVGFDTSYHRQLNLSYLYYDNRADPASLKSGQYGWHTRFHHIGGKWKLGQGWELLGQYMNGDTGMGPNKDGVDNDYWSSYLLLSKRWGKHRVTTRWDRFEVIDRDNNPFDDNTEHGYSAMASYSYKFAKGWKASASYTHWLSERPIRDQIAAGTADIKTSQLLLSLRYHWKNKP